MGKVVPKFARIPLLICALTQFLSYYLPRALPSPGYVVDMTTPFDRMITVIPAWVIVYVLAYLYWVVGYIAITRVDQRTCRVFCRADSIGKVLAAACFVLLPTHLSRPEVVGDGVFEWLLRVIYAADAPDNLFPSLHCQISWFVARYIGAMDAFGSGVKVVSFLFAALVCISTLFTGQHVIWDVIGGILFAEGAIYLSKRGMNDEAQV